MNKVLIISENPLERLGLKSLLRSSEKDYEIRDFSNLEKGLAYLKEFLPTMLLVDVALDGGDSSNLSEFSSQIKKESPQTKIMWLLPAKDERKELKAVRACNDGCLDGCLLKKDIKHLSRALELLREEGFYFPPSLLKKWFRRIVLLIESRSLKEEIPLSEREKEIVDLVRLGKTNEEIAQELYISIETVKSHLKNVRKKLRLRKARQLAYLPEHFSKIKP